MYSYQTSHVCARQINFDLNDGKVSNVSFMGGCDGNLKAVSKLIDGMDAEQVIAILEGNDCRGRGTSCADQLTRALRLALDEQKTAE